MVILYNCKGFFIPRKKIRVAKITEWLKFKHHIFFGIGYFGAFLVCTHLCMHDAYLRIVQLVQKAVANFYFMYAADIFHLVIAPQRSAFGFVTDKLHRNGFAIDFN